MEIPPETDNYIKESIEMSLGLPISEKNMQLKIVALEDIHHRLQSQIFQLEDRFLRAKAEASMNAQGLRRSIEEKEKILSEYAELEEKHAKLEEGFKRTVEACDELERENEELYAKLTDSSRMDLAAKVESLKMEKEQILVNLNKAEEEVVVLSKENKMLERENKRLMEQLKRRPGVYDAKLSASSSAKLEKRKSKTIEKRIVQQKEMAAMAVVTSNIQQHGSPAVVEVVPTKSVKGKSNLKKSSVAGRPIDSENEDARDPLTPINFNSPELDTFKTSV